MKSRHSHFKQFLETNRWLKIVPNFLTVCNSLCGFTAVLISLYAYNAHDALKIEPSEALMYAAFIVLFAMVFDALDGAAARIFNAASMHGIQMDSLADMVTFGMAPAVISAIMAHRLKPGYIDDWETSQYIFIWLACAIYLACAALRLATYNVHAILQKKSGDKFSGLPSPAGAATIATLIIFHAWAKNHGHEKIAEYTVHIIPYYAAILGLLMVSTFPYTHMFKWIQSIRRNRQRMLLVVLCIVCLIIWPAFTLIAIVNLYLISAPLTTLCEKIGIIKTLPPTQIKENYNYPIDGIS